MLLVNNDTVAETVKPEPAICEDPITGERRYRLRIADADRRPSSFRPAPIAPCALQSALYPATTNGRNGV